MLKISFITTCMDRLHHLEKTLPHNLNILKNYNYEIVVLNYNSKDNLDNWIKSYKKLIDNNKIVYGRTKHPKLFNMAHAKNVAHLISTGDILVNVDADNFLSKEYVENVLKHCKQKVCLAIKRRLNCGRLAYNRQDFIMARGYNEAMSGWGWEDIDLKNRLKQKLNVNIVHVRNFGETIQHDDKERFKNTIYKSKKESKKNISILNQTIDNVNPKGFGIENVTINWFKEINTGMFLENKINIQRNKRNIQL